MGIHREHPSRRAAAAARASRWPRVALAVAALVAIAGYSWTRIHHDVPDPSWRAVELTVDGLDCAFWCAVKVGDAIDALDGARVDSVDSVSGTVRVRFDPRRRTVEDIVNAIAARGFEVTAVRG